MRNTSILLPLKTKEREKQKGFTEASLMCCSFFRPAALSACRVVSSPPQRQTLILGDTESTCWVHSSAFSAQNSTKHPLNTFSLFSFFYTTSYLSFSSPLRLWLQRPFGNGIRRDSVGPNHGLIPVQPKLVPRALQTQLLWKCMDTGRGLKQRVDTGTTFLLMW